TPNRTGWSLVLDAMGRPRFELSNGDEQAAVTIDRAVPERRWSKLLVAVDPVIGKVRLTHCLLDTLPGEGREAAAEVAFSFAPPAFDGVPVTIAAELAETDGARLFTARHFDGKIEAPSIGRLGDKDRGRWDFSVGIDSQKIADVSGNDRHGRLINLPTRAVTGHNWKGETLRWSDRPELYGAVHFHCDDLHDMEWKTDFRWTIPGDLPSGVYAAKLSCAGNGEDFVPFFVLPAKNATKAQVAFLASTFTFLAYANSHHGYEDALSEVCYGALLELGPAEQFLKERRDFGISLYDRHRDGSGGVYSSCHRPILNTRPKRALWNFNADLHVVDWLTANGQKFDVITDDVIHEEGAALLGDYRCIITGSHPEYHSTKMLDAFEAYLGGGGRLMYLGGNGFYWRIATHPDLPGVIEVRRGEAGTRCFELPPGERFHSFTAENGGLWRSQGRAPQALVGVGFVAEGFDENSHFIRTEQSFDPRAAFIFEGVGKDEKIGDFGVLGGAAGYELDAADPDLGTPPHALVLARSVEHSNVYLLTPEELLAGFPGQDAIENPKVRAELVYFETGNDGAVFSTGSITWSASLSHDGYQNNVARITGNVLRRFLDPRPL
ncbi:MAG TPA: N,N-dimethylformamidase beta subunit family domain-containing protein, partial [Candidatus Binatia bacterium]|nr:N,N-dimethylformamidase beta subunit family domain-containing protein [Candidatus Binatia bacterium]